MNIEVSIGEIVDKLSILEIKKNKISDNTKLENITKEYDYLLNIVFNQMNIQIEDYKKILDVNYILWDIEDKIREKEFKSEFDKDFIELARSVYFTNDKRSLIKKEINIKYNSSFIEEKGYSKY